MYIDDALRVNSPTSSNMLKIAQSIGYEHIHGNETDSEPAFLLAAGHGSN
jgi:hypothetical protein